MNLLYHGVRFPEGVCVTSHRVGSMARVLPPYRHVASYTHGPFDWGCATPGAQQLALALLCHALQDSILALELCLDYKAQVVADLCSQEWVLSDTEIKRAAVLIQNARRDVFTGGGWQDQRRERRVFHRW